MKKEGKECCSSFLEKIAVLGSRSYHPLGMGFRPGGRILYPPHWERGRKDIDKAAEEFPQELKDNSKTPSQE